MPIPCHQNSDFFYQDNSRLRQPSFTMNPHVKLLALAMVLQSLLRLSSNYSNPGNYLYIVLAIWVFVKDHDRILE